MRDGALIRGDIPMTKEEVRSVSIGKLDLQKDSILYDIGAGTGSVSVECALYLPEGTVYAIEKKQEGVSLIEQNSSRFALNNIKIIEGEAPEAMDSLPAPSHAFIGGSAGRMEEILDALMDKNREIRIVVNVIALETLSQVMGWMKSHNVDGEIVCISVAKARTLSEYHMMMGQNPVYVLSFGGKVL